MGGRRKKGYERELIEFGVGYEMIFSVFEIYNKGMLVVSWDCVFLFV